MWHINETGARIELGTRYTDVIERIELGTRYTDVIEVSLGS
jgi:hypothetical protein